MPGAFLSLLLLFPFIGDLSRIFRDASPYDVSLLTRWLVLLIYPFGVVCQKF